MENAMFSVFWQFGCYFFSKILFLCMCMSIFECRLCAHKSRAHEGQKKGTDLLKVQLQVVSFLTWMVGTEVRPSARAVPALNNWTSSPYPYSFFKLYILLLLLAPEVEVGRQCLPIEVRGQVCDICFSIHLYIIKPNSSGVWGKHLYWASCFFPSNVALQMSPV